LQKQADHQRIVFVDINLPDSSIGSTGEEITNILGDTLADVENRENSGAPWPPTLVIFTNQPFHFAKTRETGTRLIIMGGALNIHVKDDSNDPSGEKLWRSWPEILTLVKSMMAHSSAPAGFGFEDDALGLHATAHEDAR
jgi:hypothetical protein